MTEYISYPNFLIMVSDNTQDHHDAPFLFDTESAVKGKKIPSLLIANNKDEYRKLIKEFMFSIGMTVIGQHFLKQKLEGRRWHNALNFIPSYRKEHKLKFQILAYGNDIIRENAYLLSREHGIIDYHYPTITSSREIVANCLKPKVNELQLMPN